MAHTLSSKGDESQSHRYTLLYDPTLNPLSVNNSTVHTSDISSMSCYFDSQELDFPEKHVEGFAAYSGTCSSSYPSEASPSRWQLSNKNYDTHFLSSNKSSENSFLATQLHIPHELSHIQSNFTCKTFDNGDWKQSLDTTISYATQMHPLLPTSNGLTLGSEATETPISIEGAMLRELLGRLERSHRDINISPRKITIPATGSASPMATGCSWNVDIISRNIGLSVDLSNEGLTQQTDFTASDGLAHVSSDIPGLERKSSFANVSASAVAVNMSLSPETASQFVDKSNVQTSMAPGGATPQSHRNAGHKFSTSEIAGKMCSSIHDLVPNEEAAAEDAGAINGDNSVAYHSVVEIDETKPLQNGAIPASSSSSGQYAAMHHGLVMDALGKSQENCIFGDKAKEISCLSEARKQKMDHEVRRKRQKISEVSKVKEELKLKVEKSSSENSGNSSPSSAKANPKLPEPPKQDYIHVRARRGQATDSHSLAERVRREKISERMKFLQELVPGCSKVTGKALMLDEIINYVQSLQHQVEFLSMKLAAVNPRLDFNFQNLLPKEMFSSLSPFPTLLLGTADNPTNLLQLNAAEQLGLSCGLDLRPSDTPAENHLQRSRRSPVPVHMHANSGSPASGVWDGELQSVVQMGFGSGDFPLGQMKTEQ